MKIRVFVAGAAMLALAAAMPASPVWAQTKGGLYVYHTSKVDKCPSLDWHVTVEPDNSLVGFVGWDNMKHMARLEGKLDKNGAFEMDAHESGGAGRNATVKGTATGNYLTIYIDGSGTACDKQVMQVPRFEGGLSGGGG
jgi:hypothetical protein